MKQNTRLPTITVPLAGLLTLVVAAALDYGLFQLRLYGGRTFNMWPILWAFSVADLVLAVLFLALAWLALRVLRPSRLSGVLLFLPGLPIAFYPVLRRSGGFFWLPEPPWLAAADHFRLAGAFLAVLGLYLIVRGSREREQAISQRR